MVSEDLKEEDISKGCLDNLSAIDALYKGLDDLESMFNEIEASYKTNLETEEHEKYVTKQMNLSAVKDMLNK